MYRRSIFSMSPPLLAVWALMALPGCGDGSDCPAQACVSSHTEVDTEAGLYHLDLLPASEPRAGGMELELAVAAAQDGIATGALEIEISLWMPAHGHGMSEQATTLELGEGSYQVTWTFPMSGYWEQTIEIDGGNGSDYAVVGYQVQ